MPRPAQPIPISLPAPCSCAPMPCCGWCDEASMCPALPPRPCALPPAHARPEPVQPRSNTQLAHPGPFALTPDTRPSTWLPATASRAARGSPLEVNLRPVADDATSRYGWCLKPLTSRPQHALHHAQSPCYSCAPRARCCASRLLLVQHDGLWVSLTAVAHGFALRCAAGHYHALRSRHHIWIGGEVERSIAFGLSSALGFLDRSKRHMRYHPIHHRLRGIEDGRTERNHPCAVRHR